jgi:hypothetical protein
VTVSQVAARTAFRRPSQKKPANVRGRKKKRKPYELKSTDSIP